VSVYDPSSKGAKAYLELARELINREGELSSAKKEK
jgi:cellulose biosynthesis protein BcsQ